MQSGIVSRSLAAQTITAENFSPYGQVIFPSADGKAFDIQDAQLKLDQGRPRFYIMQLRRRGRQFDRITRHQRCTQCLGSLEAKTWLLAVAPPGDRAGPDPADIQAFQIPGNCFVKLAVGTWHAGPYFDSEVVNFYNLELSDTNITDHDTCNLQAEYGLKFEIV
ncbi:ureidoglycolate lyase [Sphaerothrix gracilis]|uniref:ureidoglycolate lyase n=1 Tax=Sphaerothrix gracilis TaxID=3151835 RepID=UPI0031FD4825